MEEQFWQDRWQTGRIGFHEAAANLFLTRNLAALDLPEGAHVFVPLCGKTVDIDWLLAQGVRVTGVEFNRGAVEAVFDRLSLTPEVTELGGLTKFAGGNLTLWQGDAFALTAADLGAVDAIYDRAALVALPQDMRARYARHLARVTGSAPQLLVSFDYDQSQADGPPFSVPEDEIATLYAGTYDVTLLQSAPITGRLAQRCAGQEQAWKLTPAG